MKSNEIKSQLLIKKNKNDDGIKQKGRTKNIYIRGNVDKQCAMLPKEKRKRKLKIYEIWYLKAEKECKRKNER